MGTDRVSVHLDPRIILGDLAVAIPAYPSARQVESTGKYLIPSVANLRIDSFYEERQTVTPVRSH